MTRQDRVKRVHVADSLLIECYFFCNEWKYCAIHGDRFRICLAGLSLADSCPCTFQRFPHPIHGAGTASRAFIQVGPVQSLVPKHQSE